MEPGVQTEGRRKNFASILIEFQAMRLLYGAACNPVDTKTHRSSHSPMRFRFLGPIAGVARFPQ
jgi:hypothetical protein